MERAVRAQGYRLVQSPHGGLGAHGHGDDLVHLHLPSRICIAASMACVSYGFRFFSPDRSIRPVEGSIRFSTAASGTSLTRTQIFKGPPWGAQFGAAVR